MYPPIIDEETFDAVQERLAKNRYTLGGKETARVPYLLTGNVICANGQEKLKYRIKPSNQCKIILAKKEVATGVTSRST